MFIKVAWCLTTPLCYVMYQHIKLFIATSSPPKFSQIKKVFLLSADNIMMIPTDSSVKPTSAVLGLVWGDIPAQFFRLEFSTESNVLM